MAVPCPGMAILVQWQTESEIDTLGFDLYRAETVDGARTKLNDVLIPTKMPPGSPAGADYEFLDGSVELGVAYNYWLEALDVSGGAETHGPVSTGVLTLEIDPSLWSLPVGAFEVGE